MTEIYRTAIGYFWRTLPILLAVAGLIEGLGRATPLQAGPASLLLSLVRLLVFIEMAYFFHRHLLYQDPRPWGRSLQPRPEIRSGWFLATSLGLYLAALALALVGASAMLPERVALTSPRYEDVQLFAGVLFVASPAISLVLLSLFGMALPALVARNRAYRLTTGLKASPRIALGLILGPGLTGGLLLGLTLLATPRLAALTALQSPIGQWVLATMQTTLGFLPTILAVAVLCHAYRQAHPPRSERARAFRKRLSKSFDQASAERLQESRFGTCLAGFGMHQSLSTQPAPFVSQEPLDHPALKALDGIKPRLPQGQDRKPRGREGCPALTLFRRGCRSCGRLRRKETVGAMASGCAVPQFLSAEVGSEGAG